MNWATVSHVLTSAVAISWLGIAGAVVAWLTKYRAERKVKVGAFTWEHPVHAGQVDGEDIVLPEVRFTIFNGLLVDVGLHQLSLALKQGRTVRDNLIAPHVGELPESVKAQHSTVLKLDAKAVYNVRKIVEPIADLQHDAGEWSYRLLLVLGNGSEVVTKWRKLPGEERIRVGRGSAGNRRPT